MSPGKNPKSNMQFLIFLVSTIKAVYEHGDLLKASIVSQGNEARLGRRRGSSGNHVGVLGNYLSGMLDELVEKVSDRKDEPGREDRVEVERG